MPLLMRLEDGRGLAQGNYLYGRIKLEQAQDDEVIALCTESKRIFSEEADWLGVARNLNLLALCQIRKNRDFQTAHEYLQQSIALQRDLPLTASYTETLRHLARIKSVMQEFEAAEQYLSEATEVARRQKDIGEYAAVLYERLILCKRRGQRDEALRFGREALENFRKLGSLRWEALLKTQIGLLHRANQNFDEALSLLQDSLQIFSELGDKYEQAHSYFYLYQLYADLNDAERSREAKENARRLNLELNDSRLTERLNESG
ncbi:MAG: hypothetical protein D6712_10660 [Chloroflexi bacterium]|nr:MAG: hypothetical protein D6712_10660 [Chloroflexota bacterium]